MLNTKKKYKIDKMKGEWVPVIGIAITAVITAIGVLFI